jgi:hypothetical protein
MGTRSARKTRKTQKTRKSTKTRVKRKGSKRAFTRRRRGGGNSKVEKMIRQNKDKLMKISNYFGENDITEEDKENALKMFPKKLVDFFLEHRGHVIEQLSKNEYENRD